MADYRKWLRRHHEEKTAAELDRHAKDQKERGSAIEAQFRQRLRDAGIPHWYQPVAGGTIPDFILPRHGVVVEIDDSTHDHWKDVKRERFHYGSLRLRTVRLQWEQVETCDLQKLLVEHPDPPSESDLRERLKPEKRRYILWKLAGGRKGGG